MRSFKKVRLTLFVTILSIAITSCNSNETIMLEGNWRLDSILYYDNGFTYTNKSPYPSEVHVYKPDSTFLRRGMGRENKFTYSLNKKNLVIKDSGNGPGAKLKIIKADSTVLAIRKEKALVFPGKNQERFEIRFFTRMPKDSVK